MKDDTITIGPGFLLTLTVIFAVLKIAGVLTWSWLWVFCPLWIPFAIVFGFMAMMIAFGIILLTLAFIVAIID